MTDLTALAAALSALAEAHHDLGALYADLAAHLDPHGTVDGDVMMVARAIQGEGAALFGARRDEVGEWIAHVAYNRYERPYWRKIDGMPCTLAERTEVDFHGTATVEEPEPWAIRIAYRVLEQRRAGGDDPTGTRLFMLSLDDLVAMGAADRAAAMNPHKFLSPAHPEIQLWFLRQWPGD